MPCKDLLLKYLHDRGLRFTPQRELVLAVMHQLEAPATVDEIYDRVHAVSASVNISTVYRSLELFREIQLVSVFDPGDGKRRYEHVGTEPPHHHLVCQECGCVIPLAQDEAEEFWAYIADTYGFAAEPGNLTISGRCVNCREVDRQI